MARPPPMIEADRYSTASPPPEHPSIRERLLEIGTDPEKGEGNARLSRDASLQAVRKLSHIN